MPVTVDVSANYLRSSRLRFSPARWSHTLRQCLGPEQASGCKRDPDRLAGIRFDVKAATTTGKSRMLTNAPLPLDPLRGYTPARFTGDDVYSVGDGASGLRGFWLAPEATVVWLVVVRLLSG
ncbi:MAG: hypothetical protein AAF662_06330 [Pseudomonadota bacterium]